MTTKEGIASDAIERYPEKPSDLIYAQQWGALAKKARIIPLEMNEFQAAVIVQTGRELGLQPLQSLRNMSFINGRVTMSVQLQLALARAGGVRTRGDNWLQEKDNECTVTLERGTEKVTCKYTLDDAKKAGLVRPSGSYDKYTRQMLRWRAIGDALRLIAPDLVMGLLSPEEAASIDPIEKREELPFPGPEESNKGAVANDAGNTIQEVEKASADPKRDAVVGDHKDTNGQRVEIGKPITTPKPHKKGVAGFLEAMADLKKQMKEYDRSNSSYYSVLDHFDMKHANECTDEKSMRVIYLRMKEELKHLKEESLAHHLTAGEDPS